MSQYSCTTFCGLTERISKKRCMPWIKSKNLRKREFVLCRIEQIQTFFPAERSLHLIKLYGDASTSVSQTPQIV